MNKGLYILESLDCPGYHHVITIGDDIYGMNKGKKHIFDNSRIVKFVPLRYCLDGTETLQQRYNQELCFNQKKFFALSRLDNPNSKAAFFPLSVGIIMKFYCKNSYIRSSKIKNLYV